jgi:hypothetical protein
MKEQFVPYELAVKLKQLGFDEECLGFYERNQELIIQECLITDFHSDSLQCVAPLFQQAFRWFREKYGLQHDITLTADKELTGFYVLIHKLDGLVFNEDDAVELDIETTNREEAELIILDKLIEIVETKQQEQ